ncbi:MAG: hypothetical protein ACFCU9_17510 [Cyanophyceae cyanobacterium]
MGRRLGWNATEIGPMGSRYEAVSCFAPRLNGVARVGSLGAMIKS